MKKFRKVINKANLMLAASPLPPPSRISPSDLFNLLVEHPELLASPQGDSATPTSTTTSRSRRAAATATALSSPPLPPPPQPRRMAWAKGSLDVPQDDDDVSFVHPEPSPTARMEKAYWPEHTPDRSSSRLHDRVRRHRGAGGGNGGGSVDGAADADAREMNAGDHHLRATPLAAAAAFLEAMYDVVALRLRFVVTF